MAKESLMVVDDYIRVQAALCFVSVPRLLLAVSFHSELLSWNLLENIEGVTGLLQVHTAEQQQRGLECSSFSDFKPLYFSLNHIHFINIYIVKFSFVKSVTWMK